MLQLEVFEINSSDCFHFPFTSFAGPYFLRSHTKRQTGICLVLSQLKKFR